MQKRKDATTQEKHAAQQGTAITARDFFDGMVATYWEDALRAAATSSAAHETCGRRACGISGSCQLVATPGQPPVCKGGDLEAIVEKASLIVSFGCLMVSQTCGVRRHFAALLASES